MRIHRKSKYNARRVTVDGIIFHSAKEAQYYRFERQVKFELVPKQDGERSVTYKADFVTFKGDQRLEIIDAKGVKTRDYVIRRKLMLYVHKIKIVEV